MEPEQKEKILKNLPTLIDETICSAEFLAIFTSSSILSKSDVQQIKSEVCVELNSNILLIIVKSRKQTLIFRSRSLKKARRFIT